MRSNNIFLALICLMVATPAFAEVQLTVRGAADVPTSGFSFIKTPAVQIGGDLTYGLSDLLQVGGTYQHDFLQYKDGTSGTEKFYGGVVRIGMVGGPFVDAQGGLCTRDNSDTSFSFGAGLGYRIWLGPWIDLSPRFGYRSLPDSGITRSMVDFGALLTFRLF